MKKNNPSSRIYHLGSKHSFTLMELLIVIGLIAILATTAIALLNPFQQFHKANDSRRKSDLAVLERAFEDYYNDKGCYPKPADICYDPPINVCYSGVGDGSHKTVQSQICHICGSESGSPPDFSPYLDRIPCDPQHKAKDYLYTVPANPVACLTGGSGANKDCPDSYQVYSELNITDDQASKNKGCFGGGCGMNENTIYGTTVSPYPFGYGYGVSSSNTKLNTTSAFYGLSQTYTCNNCTSNYQTCLNSPPPGYQKIFTNRSSCCATLPMPTGCP